MPMSGAGNILVLLFLQKLTGDMLPRWERVVCKAIIPISLLLSVLGIAFSITALVQIEQEG